MAEYTPEQLVFIDESAVDNRTLTRRWGRSPKGKRAILHTVWVRGKRFSIEGALSVEGLHSYEIHEGSMNAETFNSFVEHTLVLLHLVCFLGYSLANPAT